MKLTTVELAAARRQVNRENGIAVEIVVGLGAHVLTKIFSSQLAHMHIGYFSGLGLAMTAGSAVVLDGARRALQRHLTPKP